MNAACCGIKGRPPLGRAAFDGNVLLVFLGRFGVLLSRAGAVQNGLQFGLVFMRKRRLQDSAAGAAQFVEHLVRQGGIDQHEQDGILKLNKIGFLHFNEVETNFLGLEFRVVNHDD